VPSGTVLDGVRHEDVQALSFADACFDLCTCTEVLEHVADDRAAFANLWRVLRPGGWLLFTVPIAGPTTLERARLRGGRREDILPPAWHLDPATGHPALVFRDYGTDVAARLEAAGFVDVQLAPAPAGLFGQGRPFVIGRRGA
jgi:SAM-dependent methyltransferase